MKKGTCYQGGMRIIARPVALTLLNPILEPQGCFASSFFRILRSSMKFKAVTVQSTLPNIIITMLSIEAGSSPASLQARHIRLRADLSEEYTRKLAPALLPF